jgi:hypothetical protein
MCWLAAGGCATIDGMAEQALVGGMDPTRGVIRVGDTVRRPGMRVPVRALLRHLEAVGFTGAPRHLGIDERGRDVVSWVEGDVPVPPYPSWALTDQALVSLGRVVRDYHDAVASFDTSELIGWSGEWSDPGGGPVVCHNDLFPENVVFRDGVVVALIDFDMAGPGRPLWDLAIAAEEWAPLHAPGARLSTPDTLDAVHRLGVLAGAYGLAADRANELLDVVVEVKATATANVRALAAAGDRVWTQHVAETDFDARVEADAQWLADMRSAFAAEIACRCA